MAALTAIWLALGWSAMFNSQYDRLESPAAPTLRPIHDGIVGVDWNDVAGADRYELQLQRLSGWVKLPDKQAAIETQFEGSSAFIGNLPADSPVHTVRVRAGSCRGWSPWSDPSEPGIDQEMERQGVAGPAIQDQPSSDIEPRTVWSARIETEESRQQPGLVGYSIRDGLGEISPGGFGDADRRFSVLKALQSSQGFVLELFGLEQFADDYLLTIEKTEASTVTRLSTCDAIRHKTSFGHRFIWPTVDLKLGDGQQLTLNMTRDSESPAMRSWQTIRPWPTLNATFAEAPSAHSGDEFSLLLRFSDPVTLDPDTQMVRGLRVTGGYPASVARVDGRSDLWQLLIVPDGRSSVQLRLLGDGSCATVDSICTQHLVPLSNQPDVTIPGPLLTVEFLDAPEYHSGLDRVAFNISLSERMSVSARSFHSHALNVRGGAIERVRRVEGRSDLWEAIVIPESSGDLVVTIDSAATCSGSEAECLGLRRISGSPSLTIPAATMHLTFDDGPSPANTPIVLDILKRHDARATFFVVGRSAVTFPEVIERIVSEGHTLANHTWAHDDLLRLTEEEVLETLMRTQQALGEHATPCFRPPNYRFNRETVRRAASIGLNMVLNTGETADWRLPGAEVITANIIRSAKPNAILVLHDGPGDRSQMIQALDAALTYLRAQRYTFEPVCE